MKKIFMGDVVLVSAAGSSRGLINCPLTRYERDVAHSCRFTSTKLRASVTVLRPSVDDQTLNAESSRQIESAKVTIVAGVSPHSLDWLEKVLAVSNTSVLWVSDTLLERVDRLDRVAALATLVIIGFDELVQWTDHSDVIDAINSLRECGIDVLVRMPGGIVGRVDGSWVRQCRLEHSGPDRADEHVGRFLGTIAARLSFSSSASPEWNDIILLAEAASCVPNSTLGRSVEELRAIATTKPRRPYRVPKTGRKLLGKQTLLAASLTIAVSLLGLMGTGRLLAAIA